MSYSFRDKQRLSDRLRGKSGDELLNELKNHIDQERKMFFDTAPSGLGSVRAPGSFARTGFPFDDDLISRGTRQDIRSHLDDLAQRHPEFADQLRCPPWGGEMSGSPSHSGSWGGRSRQGVNEDGNNQQCSSSVGSNDGSSSPKEETRGRNPIPQYGLRNTVDLGQKQGVANQDEGTRGQRSMSAPPDNRNQLPTEQPEQPQQPQQPQRFVSRVNITPGKPPVAPQKQSPQQSAGNVRHIPIFVEGRDEPLLPKTVSDDRPPEQIFSQRIPPQPQQPSFSKPQTFTSQHQFRPQQKFNTPSQQRTEHSRPPPHVHTKPETIFSPKPETVFSEQRSTPSQSRVIPPEQQETQPQHQQKVLQPTDPISRVHAIQKEVEDLQRMVENFSGTSRKEKQYIYLDEMLTRNLLKLDDIDTEGKDNVRQARKDVIRNIQRCISLLESKVPILEEQSLPTSEDIKDTEMEGACEENLNEQQVSSSAGEKTTEEKMEAEDTASVENVAATKKNSKGEKMEAEDVVPMENLVEKIDEALATGLTTESAEKLDSSAAESTEKMEVEPTSVTNEKVGELDVVLGEGNKEVEAVNVTGVIAEKNVESMEAVGLGQEDSQLKMEVEDNQTSAVPGTVSVNTNAEGSEGVVELKISSDDCTSPSGGKQAAKETDISQQEGGITSHEISQSESREAVSDTPNANLEGTSGLKGIVCENQQNLPLPHQKEDSELSSTPVIEELTQSVETEVKLPSTEVVPNVEDQRKSSNSETGQVCTDSAQEKGIKADADSKKKKTGKKVKSPSKKQSKLNASSKQTVGDAAEAES